MIETLRDISLDEPGRSCPLLVDFSERGVTSRVRDEIHASGLKTAVRSTLPGGCV